MPNKERPLALFSPSFRSIKLYRDGRIEYRGKSGSVIGATARVDESGTRRSYRDDTREVVLSIEGPQVAIVAPLPVNGLQAHRQAREFAALVNQTAMELGGSPTVPPPRAPLTRPPRADLIDQLERLGKLRDSGVLTEDEFQELKASLLRPPAEP
jgi:Short C-terminal domain